MDRQDSSTQADNSVTVGVTGHRPKSLGLKTFKTNEAPWPVAYDLATQFIYEHGATRLVSGGALGFDMIAAKAAIDAGLELELALPFVGYNAWAPKDKSRLVWLRNRAVDWYYVCDPGYATWKYQRRNEALVDRSDILLAFWNGSKSGTGNCIGYAEKQGVSVERIDPKECFDGQTV